MPSLITPALSAFAQDVAEGLGRSGQKQLASRYFYDDLGSALFEAITLLPEYGLTRADERLLQTHATAIASVSDDVATVSELGSGSGKKTRALLEAFFRSRRDPIVYRPIDVSSAALASCAREVSDVADVNPVCGDWFQGLQQIAREHKSGRLLLLFLGSSIGNLPRPSLPAFLSQIAALLHPGDLFLIGFDLVKDVETMLAGYDDPTGVTAAFNLNLLARINRELGADFDLRSFAHEARWNSAERRIEMHLLSGRRQRVWIRELDSPFDFEAGETIWTESSHKFTQSELQALSSVSGFEIVESWIDREWPFAEMLLRVRA